MTKKILKNKKIMIKTNLIPDKHKFNRGIQSLIFAITPPLEQIRKIIISFNIFNNVLGHKKISQYSFCCVKGEIK